jgi:putative inorganic carbon (hco3(-)) transporter
VSLKLILFLALFVVCTLGSFLTPLAGVLGYIAHYSIAPEQQWWGTKVAEWGLRCSYTLAVFTGIGMLVQRHKLRSGPGVIVRQEKLLLAFLALIWLTVLLGDSTDRMYAYTAVDHPSMKMLKVMIFVFMMTHVVTDLKSLDWLLWTLVASALITGLQAYTAPPSAFSGNRLDGVGGTDFRDSNALAAWLSTLLPIIGVQFLRSGWIGKGLCLVSGVFAVNAIVLTRSRGALVGTAMGAVVAVLLIPRKYRLKVLFGLIVAFAGGYRLTDPGYRERAGSINASEGDRDASAQTRIEIWKAGVAIVSDHPFGIGAGNFHQTIGKYAPALEGRDAHNTYVRCAAELGLPGIVLFLWIAGSAIASLIRIMRQASRSGGLTRDRTAYAGFGVVVSLVTMLGCGLTASLVYFEAIWWLMALPVCLMRAQAVAEQAARPAAVRGPRTQKVSAAQAG